MYLLNRANTSIATFTAPSNLSADTTLAFRLIVKDDKNATGADDVKVIDKYIPPPNQLPVANAGTDQIVNSGDRVKFDGNKSIDPDGNITSYSWRQIAGPVAKLSHSNTMNPSFIAPNVSADTQMRFALTVTDNKGATSISPAIVTITIKHINHAPIANAGTDQTVSPGDIVNLNAENSEDLDKDQIKYSWIQVEGPGVKLDDANTSMATFTAPTNISADTILVFKLTVKDSKNASNTAIVKVIDKYIPPPNQLPVANAGTDQIVNSGDRVKFDGNKSIDPDGNITSYSWRQIAGPVAKLSHSNTMNPSFIAPNVSADTQMRFALTVTDNKGATSISPAIVTITIKHINHAPIANAGTDQTVSPGDIVNLNAENSEDLDKDQIKYSWIQVEGPGVKLDDANTSMATFTAPTNISADTILVFKLTVKDSKNASNTAIVKVIDKYIPPPNQLPVANAGTDQIVNAGATVTLDGSASSDSDGIVSSYSWNQIAGPSVSINGSHTFSPSFIAPHVSSITTLVFSLTTGDDKGASSTPDNVVITVKQEVTRTEGNKASGPVCQYVPGPSMEVSPSCIGVR